MTRKTADLKVGGGGTVYTLDPVSEAGREWCEEHLPEDAPRLGRVYVIGHRFIRDIVVGARDDGLAVA